MVSHPDDIEEQWVDDIELEWAVEDEGLQDHSENENLLLSTEDEPSIPAPKPPARATAFLDGLRGLACFLVYMSHQHPSWYSSHDILHEGFGYHGRTAFATFPFLRIFFNGGNAAVAIFFVLSGYVLSAGPLRLIRDGDTAAAHRRLLSAVIRRPFRLYIPALTIALSFVFIMHLPFGLAPVLEWPVPQDSLLLELRNWVYETALLMNPFIKHGSFTQWYPYDPPAWTMPIEFTGSLLVYSMLAVTAFVPRYRMSLFSITGIIFLFIKQWSMSCFMGGVALAINDLDGIDRVLIKRFSNRVTNVVYNVLFVLAWWIVCQPSDKHDDPELSYNTPGWYYMTMLIPAMYFKDEYWRFWNTPGAILLVYAVLRLKWLQSFFTTRWLKYLGRISFSLYLLHIPFLWTVGDRIERMFGRVPGDIRTWFDYKLAIPDAGPIGFSTGFLVSQAFIFPLTMLLAELGTRILDEPSIRVGRAIVARFAPSLEKSSSQVRV
ncbi:membrane protein acetyltransferase-like protein [Eremomyces bilateralis CBS 781.70]|uniref:Membrane protein acetyltransferase-like protein n=1 Tax=Eremomyces bilateralis CBS 781.70 TaxID=1392243 RepID=A0A6G1FU98_9PEZI|nr:membrane protein acetyltransferase-like protein [Eremomyces bilateralis CBS 781.70]KAF1809320.1 membrane protein acetyltransferase-like protein [Eremomyces bilateralis CBS 781.70]